MWALFQWKPMPSLKELTLEDYADKEYTYRDSFSSPTTFTSTSTSIYKEPSSTEPSSYTSSSSFGEPFSRESSFSSSEEHSSELHSSSVGYSQEPSTKELTRLPSSSPVSTSALIISTSTADDNYHHAPLNLPPPNTAASPVPPLQNKANSHTIKLPIPQKKTSKIILPKLPKKPNNRYYNSLIYKLSENGVLQYFKKVILLSSPSDQYVPRHSARIQVRTSL